MKMKKLLVAGLSTIAFSAFAQGTDKATAPAGDQTGADHKAHAGTSKKAKQTKKSKKAKTGAKTDPQGKMDNMDHDKMQQGK